MDKYENRQNTHEISRDEQTRRSTDLGTFGADAAPLTRCVPKVGSNGAPLEVFITPTAAGI